MQAQVKMARRDLELLDSKTFEELDDDRYNYLGVLEGAGIMSKDMKGIVRKETFWVW